MLNRQRVYLAIRAYASVSYMYVVTLLPSYPLYVCERRVEWVSVKILGTAKIDWEHVNV